MQEITSQQQTMQNAQQNTLERIKNFYNTTDYNTFLENLSKAPIQDAYNKLVKFHAYRLVSYALNTGEPEKFFIADEHAPLAPEIVRDIVNNASSIVKALSTNYGLEIDKNLEILTTPDDYFKRVFQVSLLTQGVLPKTEKTVPIKANLIPVINNIADYVYKVSRDNETIQMILENANDDFSKGIKQFYLGDKRGGIAYLSRYMLNLHDYLLEQEKGKLPYSEKQYVEVPVSLKSAKELRTPKYYFEKYVSETIPAQIIGGLLTRKDPQKILYGSEYHNAVKAIHEKYKANFFDVLASASAYVTNIYLTQAFGNVAGGVIAKFGDSVGLANKLAHAFKIPKTTALRIISRVGDFLTTDYAIEKHIRSRIRDVYSEEAYKDFIRKFSMPRILISSAIASTSLGYLEYLRQLGRISKIPHTLLTLADASFYMYMQNGLPTEPISAINALVFIGSQGLGALKAQKLSDYQIRSVEMFRNLVKDMSYKEYKDFMAKLQTGNVQLKDAIDMLSKHVSPELIKDDIFYIMENWLALNGVRLEGQAFENYKANVEAYIKERLDTDWANKRAKTAFTLSTEEIESIFGSEISLGEESALETVETRQIEIREAERIRDAERRANLINGIVNSLRGGTIDEFNASKKAFNKFIKNEFDSKNIIPTKEFFADIFKDDSYIVVPMSGSMQYDPIYKQYFTKDKLVSKVRDLFDDLGADRYLLYDIGNDELVAIIPNEFLKDLEGKATKLPTVNANKKRIPFGYIVTPNDPVIYENTIKLSEELFGGGAPVGANIIVERVIDPDAPSQTGNVKVHITYAKSVSQTGKFEIGTTTLTIKDFDKPTQNVLKNIVDASGDYTDEIATALGLPQKGIVFSRDAGVVIAKKVIQEEPAVKDYFQKTVKLEEFEKYLNDIDANPSKVFVDGDKIHEIGVDKAVETLREKANVDADAIVLRLNNLDVGRNAGYPDIVDAIKKDFVSYLKSEYRKLTGENVGVFQSAIHDDVLYVIGRKEAINKILSTEPVSKRITNLPIMTKHGKTAMKLTYDIIPNNKAKYEHILNLEELKSKLFKHEERIVPLRARFRIVETDETGSHVKVRVDFPSNPGQDVYDKSMILEFENFDKYGDLPTILKLVNAEGDYIDDIAEILELPKKGYVVIRKPNWVGIVPESYVKTTPDKPNRAIGHQAIEQEDIVVYETKPIEPEEVEAPTTEPVVVKAEEPEVVVSPEEVVSAVSEGVLKEEHKIISGTDATVIAPDYIIVKLNDVFNRKLLERLDLVEKDRFTEKNDLVIKKRKNDLYIVKDIREENGKTVYDLKHVYSQTGELKDITLDANEVLNKFITLKKNIKISDFDPNAQTVEVPKALTDVNEISVGREEMLVEEQKQVQAEAVINEKEGKEEKPVVIVEEKPQEEKRKNIRKTRKKAEEKVKEYEEFKQEIQSAGQGEIEVKVIEGEEIPEKTINVSKITATTKLDENYVKQVSEFFYKMEMDNEFRANREKYFKSHFGSEYDKFVKKLNREYEEVLRRSNKNENEAKLIAVEKMLELDLKYERAQAIAKRIGIEYASFDIDIPGHNGLVVYEYPYFDGKTTRKYLRLAFVGHMLVEAPPKTKFKTVEINGKKYFVVPVSQPIAIARSLNEVRRLITNKIFEGKPIVSDYYFEDMLTGKLYIVDDSHKLLIYKGINKNNYNYVDFENGMSIEISKLNELMASYQEYVVNLMAKHAMEFSPNEQLIILAYHVKPGYFDDLNDELLNNWKTLLGVKDNNRVKRLIESAIKKFKESDLYKALENITLLQHLTYGGRKPLYDNAFVASDVELLIDAFSYSNEVRFGDIQWYVRLGTFVDKLLNNRQELFTQSIPKIICDTYFTQREIEVIRNQSMHANKVVKDDGTEYRNSAIVYDENIGEVKIVANVDPLSIKYGIIIEHPLNDFYGYSPTVEEISGLKEILSREYVHNKDAKRIIVRLLQYSPAIDEKFGGKKPVLVHVDDEMKIYLLKDMAIQYVATLNIPDLKDNALRIVKKVVDIEQRIKSVFGIPTHIELPDKEKSMRIVSLVNKVYEIYGEKAPEIIKERFGDTEILEEYNKIIKQLESVSAELTEQQGTKAGRRKRKGKGIEYEFVPREKQIEEVLNFNGNVKITDIIRFAYEKYIQLSDDADEYFRKAIEGEYAEVTQEALKIARYRAIESGELEPTEKSLEEIEKGELNLELDLGESAEETPKTVTPEIAEQQTGSRRKRRIVEVEEQGEGQVGEVEPVKRVRNQRTQRGRRRGSIDVGVFEFAEDFIKGFVGRVVQAFYPKITDRIVRKNILSKTSDALSVIAITKDFETTQPLYIRKRLFPEKVKQNIETYLTSGGITKEELIELKIKSLGNIPPEQADAIRDATRMYYDVIEKQAIQRIEEYIKNITELDEKQGVGSVNMAKLVQWVGDYLRISYDEAYDILTKELENLPFSDLVVISNAISAPIELTTEYNNKTIKKLIPRGHPETVLALVANMPLQPDNFKLDKSLPFAYANPLFTPIALSENGRISALRSVHPLRMNIENAILTHAYELGFTGRVTKDIQKKVWGVVSDVLKKYDELGVIADEFGNVVERRFGEVLAEQLAKEKINPYAFISFLRDPRIGMTIDDVVNAYKDLYKDPSNFGVVLSETELRRHLTAIHSAIIDFYVKTGTFMGEEIGVNPRDFTNMSPKYVHRVLDYEIARKFAPKIEQQQLNELFAEWNLKPFKAYDFPILLNAKKTLFYNLDPIGEIDHYIGYFARTLAYNDIITYYNTVKSLFYFDEDPKRGRLIDIAMKSIVFGIDPAKVYKFDLIAGMDAVDIFTKLREYSYMFSLMFNFSPSIKNLGQMWLTMSMFSPRYTILGYLASKKNPDLNKTIEYLRQFGAVKVPEEARFFELYGSGSEKMKTTLLRKISLPLALWEFADDFNRKLAVYTALGFGLANGYDMTDITKLATYLIQTTQFNFGMAGRPMYMYMPSIATAYRFTWFAKFPIDSFSSYLMTNLKNGMFGSIMLGAIAGWMINKKAREKLGIDLSDIIYSGFAWARSIRKAIDSPEGLSTLAWAPMYLKMATAMYNMIIDIANSEFTLSNIGRASLETLSKNITNVLPTFYRLTEYLMFLADRPEIKQKYGDVNGLQMFLGLFFDMEHKRRAREIRSEIKYLQESYINNVSKAVELAKQGDFEGALARLDFFFNDKIIQELSARYMLFLAGSSNWGVYFYNPNRKNVIYSRALAIKYLLEKASEELRKEGKDNLYYFNQKLPSFGRSVLPGRTQYTPIYLYRNWRYGIEKWKEMEIERAINKIFRIGEEENE